MSSSTNFSPLSFFFDFLSDPSPLLSSSLFSSSSSLFSCAGCLSAALAISAHIGLLYPAVIAPGLISFDKRLRISALALNLPSLYALLSAISHVSPSSVHILLSYIQGLVCMCVAICSVTFILLFAVR